MKKNKKVNLSEILYRTLSETLEKIKTSEVKKTITVPVTETYKEGDEEKTRTVDVEQEVTDHEATVALLRSLATAALQAAVQIECTV